MFNKLAKVLLVSTSLSPILLTFWFYDFSQEWDIMEGWGYLVAASILAAFCLIIIKLAKNKLESFPIKIISAKTADKEVISFILVYLLPLINKTQNVINLPVLIFVAILFFYITATSNAHHLNPVLNLFGYHFYDVTIEGGISYVLITKKNISNCKSITNVVQLSEYTILEV